MSETDKTTRWSITVYEDQWHLFHNIQQYPDIAEWGWQKEMCPKTQRLHYQGFIRTKRQIRCSGMRKMIPQVHIEPAREWYKLRNYCRKQETQISGTQVHATNETEFWPLERLMIELTNHIPAAQEHINELLTRRHEVKDIAHEMFWFCARQILTDEPRRAAALNQPSIEKFFKMTSSVWTSEVTRALVLQPVAQEGPELVELLSPPTVSNNGSTHQEVSSPKAPRKALKDAQDGIQSFPEDPRSL